jgi:hypothetical protein
VGSKRRSQGRTLSINALVFADFHWGISTWTKSRLAGQVTLSFNCRQQALALVDAGRLCSISESADRPEATPIH